MSVRVKDNSSTYIGNSAKRKAEEKEQSIDVSRNEAHINKTKSQFVKSPVTRWTHRQSCKSADG